MLIKTSPFVSASVQFNDGGEMKLLFPYKVLSNLVFIFQIPRVIEEELTDDKVAEQNSNQGERHESQETLTTA